MSAENDESVANAKARAANRQQKIASLRTQIQASEAERDGLQELVASLPEEVNVPATVSARIAALSDVVDAAQDEIVQILSEGARDSAMSWVADNGDDFGFGVRQSLRDKLVNEIGADGVSALGDSGHYFVLTGTLREGGPISLSLRKARPRKTS